MNSPTPQSARVRVATASPHAGSHGLSLAVVTFVFSVAIVLFLKQEKAQATAGPMKEDTAAQARIRALEEENARLRAEIERMRQ